MIYYDIQVFHILVDIIIFNKKTVLDVSDSGCGFYLWILNEDEKLLHEKKIAAETTFIQSC